MGGLNGYAYGINNAGAIVGRSQNSGGIYQAYIVSVASGAS